MKNEKDKMLAGELYDPLDLELVQDRERSHILCKRFNDSHEKHQEERRRILTELFGYATDVVIHPSFYCDYGFNIALGNKVVFNFNCVVLDTMNVEIGDSVFVGPSVHIYTAMHPMDATARRTGLEFAKPVSIGSDVWIGGGAIICPGVTIGSRSIIGAGSVVTRSIPADVFAAGNPCRVIRSLQDA